MGDYFEMIAKQSEVGYKHTTEDDKHRYHLRMMGLGLTSVALAFLFGFASLEIS